MPLTAPAEVTNSPAYSGYLYAQCIGTFKGPYNCCRYGKYVQNLQNVTAAVLIVSAVELHLCGLVGAASLLDMQKIRTIEHFIESRPHWQFLQTVILGHIFIYK